MNPYPLLRILADGRFHSGDELGRALGVGRGAVWKGIRDIRALGLDVHSVRGKGYRLTESLELLERKAILAALEPGPRARLADLELADSVDSTNDLVMRRLRAGDLALSDGRLHACLAERQTAGRGRRGRDWISPFGCNMYLSAAREFASGAVALEGLSLVVALALIAALEDCGVGELNVKWPNDVLWRGRKLAGILLEMSGDVCGQCQVIIGVGLNIRAPAAAMGAVSQPWADVSGICPDFPGRNALVGRFLDHLIGSLDRFELEGFSPFRAQWDRLDAFRDAAVLLSGAGGPAAGHSGIVRGVDGRGALLLETARGVHAFHGGEVSLRAAGDQRSEA